MSGEKQQLIQTDNLRLPLTSPPPHPVLTLVCPLLQDKPAVLSLQDLMVRDIANQERGMFLIIDSAPPVMYEFHATSKDNKNVWMRHIQQAVNRSVPRGQASGSEVRGQGECQTTSLPVCPVCPDVRPGRSSL